MLSKLGIDATWLGALGADPFGTIILDALRADGVNTEFVQVVPTKKTAVYFKDVTKDSTQVFYYRESSAMSHAGPELLSEVSAKKWDLVHMSGITPALSESCRELTLETLSGPTMASTTKSFDINFRPGLWPAGDAPEVLRDIADRCDIVFVGLDEAEALWGVNTAHDVRAILSKPAYIVVKDSEHVATEMSAAGTSTEPAIEVDIVEKVGAGDAFAAGWLAGYLRGESANSRLRMGHLMAAEVLKTHTDTAAPPSPEVLARALRPASPSLGSA
jgi:2-dehydro-3-deoxygluconokinase